MKQFKTVMKGLKVKREWQNIDCFKGEIHFKM